VPTAPVQSPAAGVPSLANLPAPVAVAPQATVPPVPSVNSALNDQVPTSGIGGAAPTLPDAAPVAKSGINPVLNDSAPVQPQQAPGNIGSLTDETPRASSGAAPVGTGGLGNSGLDALAAKLDSIDSKLSRMDEKFVSKSELADKIDEMLDTKLNKLVDTKFNAVGGLEQVATMVNRVEEVATSMNKVNDRLSSLDQQMGGFSAKFDEHAKRIALLEEKLMGKKAPRAEAPVAEEHEVRTRKGGVDRTMDADARRARVERSEEDRPVRVRHRQVSSDETVSRVAPPKKPQVVQGYSLKGVTRDTAWVQSANGMMQVTIGQEIPGVGTISNIGRGDGGWMVVTSGGVILP
jgi:hypothetical protein